MVTALITGAEFDAPIKAVVATAVPVSVPSLGVTVHLTVSPATKPVLTVVPVPIVVVPTVQAIVDESMSPSSSEKL